MEFFPLCKNPHNTPARKRAAGKRRILLENGEKGSLVAGLLRAFPALPSRARRPSFPATVVGIPDMENISLIFIGLKFYPFVFMGFFKNGYEGTSCADRRNFLQRGSLKLRPAPVLAGLPKSKQWIDVTGTALALVRAGTGTGAKE
jgi:hypothetical protein